MATQTSSASKSPSKKVFKVPSSQPGKPGYDVALFADGTATCTCPSYERIKPSPCKHISALNPKSAALKSVPKDEPTQPKPTGGVAGVFSSKVAAPTLGAKKAKGKSKPLSEIPAELVPHAEVMVAGKMVNKRIENKIKAATDAVKSWCLQKFAEVYAATGSRPATTTVIGGKAKFDFIQTKRIYLSPDRVQAVRDMGVDIDNWTDIKGVNINYEAIKRHGLESKLQEALGSMGISDAILGEILQPKHEVREGFFDSLFSVVQGSLKKGEDLSDKMFGVLLALQPVSQTKNPEIELGGANEDDRLASALRLILDSPVASVGESNEEERDDE